MNNYHYSRTREDWMNDFFKVVHALFKSASYEVKQNLRFSCGFPYGFHGKKANGQCWSVERSDDGTFEIFVSPEVDEGREVAAILIHEITHSIVGLDQGHGKAFRDCARKVGLIKPFTSSVAGDRLNGWIDDQLKVIGTYPHAKLTPDQIKRQGTRMIKLTCFNCGYTVRAAQKWIDKGLPLCPCSEIYDGEVITWNELVPEKAPQGGETPQDEESISRPQKGGC